jgi:Undecaprenyl-phosphate galactose phosphotransferase WbaP
MTSGISEVEGLTEVTGIDATALDGVFLDDEDVLPRTTGSTSAAPARVSDHGRNGNGHAGGNGHANGNGNAAAILASFGAAGRLGLAVDSTPDGATFARHLNQSIKTAGPLLAADVIAVGLAGLLAQACIALLHPGAQPVAGTVVTLATIPIVLGYWLIGLYSEVWVHPALELRQTTLVTTIVTLAAGFASHWATPAAPWLVIAWVIAVPAVPLARATVRCWCCGRGWWGFPTLIIGARAPAEDLARSLTRSGTSGLRPALLTDPEGLCRTSLVPVVNDPALLRSLVRSKGIRHAVLCLTDLPTTSLSKAFDHYGSLAPHLLVVCEPPPLPALWGAQRFCGLGGVEVRNGLLLAPLRAVKRAMDVVLSVIALTVGLPLLLAIAALVKLSSPGPVLYGHKRIGRHGRRFTAWKFRTMYRGADALLRQHLEQKPSARLEWERDQKLRHDPRVTPLGRVLRTLSLDELPQMWNVLRGEMSVVGPRPIVDEEVARYGESFPLYTAVKPGITGLWQVSGRTDVGYDMRVRLDGFYVRHWSPWLDAYVLVRTVAALLCRKGAY